MYKLNKNINSVWARVLLYRRALKSHQKIVVFESDDWGAIRTSDRSSFNYLKNRGYNLDRSPYAYDALESNQDLEELFYVLSCHKDFLGNLACFTANVILANPNFDLIQKSGYREYHYETVQETALRYHNSSRIIELWKKGCTDGVFLPQVHAREHVKYWKWLKDLQNNVEEALETFTLRMCGVPKNVSKTGTSYYSPLYVDDDLLHRNYIHQELLISEAFELFEKLLGFSSKSTIAPNCGWTDTTEKIWQQHGVRFIQGGFLQEHHNEETIKYIPHYLGEKSKNGDLIYLVRNCTFEPAKSNTKDYWKMTFKQVERAFKLNTPAIISTHRVNYIGSIKPEIRENSLIQLDELLSNIQRRWPDVVFLNSTQLGEMIYDRTL